MNKLTIVFYSLALLSLMTSGCKKDYPTDEFQQKYNGKYAIVSATVNKQVDVNFDGVANTELLKEIATLKDSYLELIIRDNVKSYVFSQFWQNQFFDSVDEKIPSIYDPSIIVNYVNQATVSSFTIDQEQSKLILGRENIDSSFPLPDSVEILPNQNIKVRMSKSLYTSSGWQNVALTVVYERFIDQF
ncbi:hypothetical protein [Pedobacter antarcticus]|uniref:hypothetical protein n=1 Tax=Pedobacter antarcticus TaxID=34086 RepID=UPI001C587ED4|nr:hypothetical protein [Pedobacter antarcticus]